MTKARGDGEAMENAVPAAAHGDLGGGEPGKCNAKKHQGNGLCRNPAGYKTDHVGFGHCHLHGGNTANGKKYAEGQRVERLADMQLRRQGITPVTDPLTQLAQVAGEILGFKDVLADQVEQLTSWENYDNLNKEELRAVIAAYERALDRSEKVLNGMARLNLEERQQKLSAMWGAVMVELLEAVLGAKELGLTKPQLQTAKAVVARELPRFAATPAA